jgi:hypothetical protein
MLLVFWTGAATSSKEPLILMRLNGPCARPPYLSENLVALGIEPGTSGSVAKIGSLLHEYVHCILLFLL